MGFFSVLKISVAFISVFGTLAALPKSRLKVLVFSPPVTWSHSQFMGTIADILTEAGHEVHFLRLIPNNFTNDWPNEVHKVHTVHNIHQSFAENSINVQHVLPDPFDGKQFHTFIWQTPSWRNFIELCSNICKELVWHEQTIRRLEAEKFDVAISELYNICPFALFHRIGAKTKLAVLAAPLFQATAQRFGIPTFASYVNDIFSTTDAILPMPFVSRLVNFINALYSWVYNYDFPIKIEENIVRRAFGDEFPKMDEIARNISLMFVNSNQFFEMPRPISNKVINVGGLVEMEQKPLEANMSRLLDNAKSGVIFISFGTFTPTHLMPAKMKMAFLHAMAHFSDFEFIWKLELSEEDAKLFVKYKNVHPIKWADQKAILMHPKTRAFVTHCGLNSVTESVRAGVPVLGVPLFGDQLYNAILAVQKGVGVKLDVNALKGDAADEVFLGALDKILHNPSFRENAQLVKRKFELTPFGPRDKLVRWVEFAAQFAELNELNLPWDDQLNFLAFYSVDVLLLLAILLTFFIWATFKLATFLAKCLLTTERKKKD